jgi:DNA adenine methylase
MSYSGLPTNTSRSHFSHRNEEFKSARGQNFIFESTEPKMILLYSCSVPKLPKSSYDKSLDVRPFLRWAGGKRRISKMLLENFPTEFDAERNRYFEPFLGGGAVAFASGNPTSEHYIPGTQLVLNDMNAELVNTYCVVRDNIGQLIKKLDEYSELVDPENYYEIRASKPSGIITRAARFIYLNKTCYNGLWRVNSKGLFNVPFDPSSSGKLYDEKNLRACSERLQGSIITHGNYVAAVKNIRRGDFVYFDPPYIPLSRTENFSSYAKEGFSLHDQQKLAELIAQLDQRGISILLSNSDTPLTREIFEDALVLRKLLMSRTIGSQVASRRPVSEILGMNYRHPYGASMGKLKLVSSPSER